MDKLLKLLQENARFSNEQLAVMLDTSAAEIEKKIKNYEKKGIIKGYNTLINHDKLEEEFLTAIIELKVTPKKQLGFDDIAKTVMAYREVESVYLMSGGYDLSVVVRGDSFKDIALFVSQRLAPLDSVLSTATHFVLSRYKEKGVVMYDEPIDERGVSLL